MTDAIEKSEQKQVEFIRTNAVDEALRHVAAQMTLALTPPQIATLFERLKDWATVVEDLHSGMRERLIQFAKAEGFEGSTCKREVSGWVLEVRKRAAVDPRKLESLLRAKGANPQLYMTPEITYKVSQAGLQLLVVDGVMTQEEIETCKPTEQYTVLTPKRAGDVNE